MTKIRIASCFLLVAGLALAQQTLNNDSVLKLVKAGMGDDLIVNMINTQPGAYSVTTDDLIFLKAAGIPEKVIGAMVVKGSGTQAPGITTTITPVPGLVSEVGIYYKQASTWVDLNPEGVSFKTGGVLKSIATDGLVKGDINGHLAGEHSKTALKTPVEVLIYVPEGVAATEYQLLHLRESGKAREFRTVTGGVFHRSGGASRDALEFEAKKIAPRTFAITLSNLKSGEYGLLPPASGDGTGSSGRLGKLYTFQIIE
jgi:hypothetical protein